MVDFYEAIIHEISRQNPGNLNVSRLGGGCIHQAVALSCDQGNFFIKSNQAAADMFSAEARGLQLLSEAGVIAVPEVHGYGTVDGQDYLCLELIQKGPANDTYWQDFGEQLAALHQITSKSFGLDHDNYIGRLPQSNRWHDSWAEFFAKERIAPQIDMATQSGLINLEMVKQFDLLLDKLEELLPNEHPALIHGDLWSGNVMSGEGKPYIFDPAVYFGHREAEIAFTTLFGGFDTKFYDAYSTVFPLQPGYKERMELFNLYPLLVHVNLFGQSYMSQVAHILKRFT